MVCEAQSILQTDWLVSLCKVYRTGRQWKKKLALKPFYRRGEYRNVHLWPTKWTKAENLGTLEGVCRLNPQTQNTLAHNIHKQNGAHLFSSCLTPIRVKPSSCLSLPARHHQQQSDHRRNVVKAHFKMDFSNVPALCKTEQHHSHSIPLLFKDPK